MYEARIELKNLLGEFMQDIEGPKRSESADNQEQGSGTPAPKKPSDAPSPKPPAPANAESAPAQPVRPPVEAARLRRRHRGVAVSFLFLVLVPLSLVIGYLWFVAKDQYASVTGFTVRQEEGGGASELVGGLVKLTGSSVNSDGDILYEYILSQALVQRVEAQVELREHFSEHWESDPVFSLWPDANIEDLEWFWRRILRISYDQGSGLMEVRVLAFSPEKANEIAQEILKESQRLINAVNDKAREDATRYALDDLKQAVERLKVSRESLSAFRTRTQIIDPEADITARLGVMNNLQQQLAEALVAHDLLLETTSKTDPRLAQAQLRIQTIKERIRLERQAFATGDIEIGAVGEDYPKLLAEYEGLIVDREFAEQTYRAALTAVDLARANAQRQSRYLAIYIPPTFSESSEYPQRFIIAGLVALLLVLSWATMALVYYSIRDRR